MKGRNAQVARIYKILTILEGAPHGLSVADLASHLQDRGFDVGKRTVYRDLDALRAAGFPLEERGKSDEQGTRWALERAMRVNHYLVLNSRELLSLYLARSVLMPLKDTPFYEDLLSTFHKIEEKLGSKSQVYLRELSDELHFEPGPSWGLGLVPDVVETVRAACTERHRLRVTYSAASSGVTGERELGPQFLYFSKGSLYLIAEDFKDNVTKTFSLARMSAASMLDTPYDGAVTDPDSYFASAFGIYRSSEPVLVKLLFTPALAPFVKERRWHTSQKVIVRDQGRIELSLEVGLTPEIVQWVLGFGANVSVVEPPALQAMIRDEAARVVDLYGRKGERAAG
ncbi:MAG: transcriptional regulator [Deltaproteobacteria bacterium]|nr:transcriptional regulator [Deltaproteobacteria bacterium]